MPAVPAPAHDRPTADVVEALQSDANSGLSEADASRRLHAHGTNTLTIRGGKPGWRPLKWCKSLGTSTPA